MREQPDDVQERLVAMHGCTALLLAGPGCGKTHILARRVITAYVDQGVDFGQMLCVTFTNRAAREMQLRIEHLLGVSPPELFIGNMHRFCLAFLYRNGLISDDTSVLDEDERDEYLYALGIYGNKQLDEFLRKAALVYQRENDHPENLIRLPRTPITDIDRERIDTYRAYKEANALIDYDDILLKAYTALMQTGAADFAMTGYRWVQVDEVQDMTALQLAIVDMVTVPRLRTMLFLGDEQQAIFNFTGAGGRTLEFLKHRCRGNIVRMKRNYRSATLLVEICNAIAAGHLGIDRQFLPEAVAGNELASEAILVRATDQTLNMVAAATARRWLAEQPFETIGVLVRTNQEGNELSAFFKSAGIDHFHVSRRDLFHGVPYKTIWAHLAAIAQPHNRQAWARLLYQMRIVKSLASAQHLTALLTKNAMECSALLELDKPTAVERFTSDWNSDRVITVIDTETTGLDPLRDDVIQIAAVKVHGGRLIEGSQFEIFIDSDRPIPYTLRNGTPNPIARLYDTAPRLRPREAFEMLDDYLGDSECLAGHNLRFDKDILRTNIMRRTPCRIPPALAPDAPSHDSLSLSHLLVDGLKNYRLETLIDALAIDATNSHNAVDDTLATAMLLSRLAVLGQAKLHLIRDLRANVKIRRIAAKFADRYASFHNYWLERFNETTPGARNNLSSAIDSAAIFFADNGFTAPLPCRDYVVRLIETCLADPACDTLRRQLTEHLYSLLTFKESDLLANGIVETSVSIMTVHKAKGLEMDSVIMLDVSKGMWGSADDNARLLYVAFSRAKRRLMVGVSGSTPPALASVSARFRQMSQQEIARCIINESGHLNDQ